MADRLSKIATHVFQDAHAFSKLDGSPVLVWVKAPPVKKKTLILGTLSNYKPEPPAQDPMVFRLRKMNRPGNAFALGVTLGRADTNDIALDDGSVSRFHAYFQQDKQSGIWHVIDAESFNGTSCDATWLSPNRPAPLSDGCDLKFGNVEMQFFSVAAFSDWVKNRHVP